MRTQITEKTLSKIIYQELTLSSPINTVPMKPFQLLSKWCLIFMVCIAIVVINSRPLECSETQYEKDGDGDVIMEDASSATLDLNQMPSS